MVDDTDGGAGGDFGGTTGTGEVPSGFTAGGEVIETRTGKVWLDEDGFLHGWAKPGSEMTVADAAEITAAKLRLVGERRMRVMVDISNVHSMSRDAREEMRKSEHTRGTIALALIVRSPVSRVIGNFFITLSRPDIPVKLFTSSTAARAWLAQFPE